MAMYESIQQYHASIHLSTRTWTQHGCLNQVPDGGSAATLIGRASAGRPYVWQQDSLLCHTKGAPSLGRQKISASTSPLTFLAA